MINKKLNVISLCIIGLLSVSVVRAKDINIADLGLPDSQNAYTTIIQQAIDDCSATGGGRVTIPAGVYTVGAVKLKSGVELHLSKGAYLKGSTNHPQDYEAGCAIIVTETSLNAIKNVSSTFSQPLIRLNDCKEFVIGHCRNGDDNSGTLLQIDGKESSTIKSLFPLKSRTKINKEVLPAGISL